MANQNKSGAAGGDIISDRTGGVEDMTTKDAITTTGGLTPDDGGDMTGSDTTSGDTGGYGNDTGDISAAGDRSGGVTGGVSSGVASGGAGGSPARQSGGAETSDDADNDNDDA